MFLTLSDFGSLVNLDSPEFSSDDYIELSRIVQEEKSSLPDVKVIDNFVYKRTNLYNDEILLEDHAWKLWIPAALTQSVIEKAHSPPNMAHGGIAKTIKRIREYFYWPHLNIQVRDFVNRCDVCKECKPANTILKPPMGKEADASRPFQRIYIDFLGPYVRSKRGNSYIFIILDHVTKFVLLKAMSKANTRNVVDFLVREVFNKFGFPEIVVSDNGLQFVSKEFGDLMKTFEINHCRTGVYAPQANASERVNQSILSAIRSYLGESHNEWDLHLCEIESALRSAVHSAIGMTPYFALFVTNMITHASAYKIARRLNVVDEPNMRFENRHDFMELIRDKLKERLHKSYESNARKYNVRARIARFTVGQEVFRRNFQLSDFAKQITAKLCRKFLKCRIAGIVGNCLYEIETLQGKPLGVFHAKDLKA